MIIEWFEFRCKILVTPRLGLRNGRLDDKSPPSSNFRTLIDNRRREERDGRDGGNW